MARHGWEGNNRLQDFVRRVDPGAALIAEVVELVDESIIALQDDWDDGTVTGGSVDFVELGGVRLQASTSQVIQQATDDATDVQGLSHVEPYDYLWVEWLDADPDRLIRNFIARLDARRDGGQPVTVYEWRCQAFRVIRIEGADLVHIEPISQEVAVLATGEAPGDVTFDFFDPSAPGGGPYPRIGEGPVIDDEGGNNRPITLFRIIALRDDGTPADNVTWLADSTPGGSITDSSTYLVTHYSSLPADADDSEYAGGTVIDRGSIVNNMPRFTLNRPGYATATVTFDGAEEIPDLPGSGDLVIVTRASVPLGTSVLFEVSDDGVAWETCFDGDVIGQDNSAQGGGDLSGVSTTGPWDMRVTLTPDAAGLNTPYVREMGIERIVRTELAGAAEVTGGARTVDPQTLKGNIPRAEVAILKTGERDFRDYGSVVLSGNHIGEIEVRVWIGDPTGDYLNRSEWMLHSVWKIDDFRSEDDAHVLECVSPMQLLRRRIPPFVATVGNDGTRTAVAYANQAPQVVYDDLLDNQLGVPTRHRGQGLPTTADTIGKTLKRVDCKDELDRVAYLLGYSVIESQGRVKAVPFMRDGPGAGLPIKFFPLGSYSPVRIGPGFTSRTDEFFVRFNWSESREDFDDERRYFNATALNRLGGFGLSTTQELDAETCEWIATTALADAIGRRVPAHFGNGLIYWEIASIDRNPELEPGDVVAVETNLFVARSPIDDREIRGNVYALAVVAVTGDTWGHQLGLWVPSFDKIVVLDGDVGLTGFQVFDLAVSFSVTFVASSTAGGNLIMHWECGADVETIRVDMAYFDGELQSWDYTFSTGGARQGEHTIEEQPPPGGLDHFALIGYTLYTIDARGQNAAATSDGLTHRQTFASVPDIPTSVGSVRAIQGASDLTGSALRIGQAGYLALATVSQQPEVELSMGVFAAGAQGANFSLDYDDGPVQTASITASVELTDILNLDGSTPFTARISCGANTLTLNATNFEGPVLSFTGVVSLSFMDFGTGAIAVAGIEY